MQRTIRPTRWLGVAVLVLTVAGSTLPAQQSPATATAPSPAPGVPPTTPAIQALLDAMRDSLRVYGVHGAGLALVTRDSVIWAGGIGTADPARGDAVAATTQFRLASITKTFTAVATMQLVDRGLLDLNARLAVVAPDVEFTNPWEAQSPVRLVNLLQHSAGFDARYGASLNRLGPDASWEKVLHLTRRARVVRWPPGSMEAYTNEAYAVAAYVVERVSGHSWRDQLKTEILRPLGMTTTGVGPRDSIGSLAVGDHGRASMATDYLLQQPVYSSPAEMASFVRMFLGRGELDGRRVLSESSLTRMEQATVDSTTGRPHHGLGLWSYQFTPARIYGHIGRGWDTSTIFAYSPELGIGFFVGVTKYQTPALRCLARLAFDFLARREGKVLPTPPPGIRVAAQTLQRYAGVYRLVSTEYGAGWTDPFVSISAAGDGSLVEQFGSDAAVTLVAVSDSVFRQANHFAASRFFEPDGSNGMVLVRAMDRYERVPGWLAWVAPHLEALFDLCFTGALVVCASCVLFALVWIPRRLRKRLSGVTRLAMRWLPLAALATFAVSLAFVDAPLDPSRSAVVVAAEWILLSLATMLGGAGLVAAARADRGAGHWLVRAHAALTSVAVIYLVVTIAFLR